MLCFPSNINKIHPKSKKSEKEKEQEEFELYQKLKEKFEGN